MASPFSAISNARHGPSDIGGGSARFYRRSSEAFRPIGYPPENLGTPGRPSWPTFADLPAVPNLPAGSDLPVPTFLRSRQATADTAGSERSYPPAGRVGRRAMHQGVLHQRALHQSVAAGRPRRLGTGLRKRTGRIWLRLIRSPGPTPSVELGRDQRPIVTPSIQEFAKLAVRHCPGCPRGGIGLRRR